MSIQAKDIKNINRLIRIIKVKYEEFDKNRDRFLLAAMIVNKNKISIGFNSYVKTHPATIQPGPNYLITTHAEVDAINKWNENWEITKSTTMYVIGLNSSGNFCSSSKPCKGCMEKIGLFGIRNVIYINRKEKSFNINLITL